MAKAKKKDRYRGKRLSHYDSGKPIYKYFSAHSERELQRKMLDWEREKDSPKSVPFKDIANEWFDIHSEKIETITANSYNIILK